MIVLLDTTQDFDRCAAELGYPVEQLFTPLTRYLPRQPGRHFAIDNGSFSKFDPRKFNNLLKRHHARRHRCRFVAVPDRVENAQRTAELFDEWAPQLRDWPLAYVCQDGQDQVPIPWDRIASVFIGGSTAWKISRSARACIAEARARKKWVHVGRVNTPDRLEFFEELLADSIDGTGLSRYTHMREKIARRNDQLRLELNHSR